jgi:hypothetical protein
VESEAFNSGEEDLAALMLLERRSFLAAAVDERVIRVDILVVLSNSQPGAKYLDLNELLNLLVSLDCAQLC